MIKNHTDELKNSETGYKYKYKNKNKSRNINIPENDAKRWRKHITDNSSRTNAKEKYMNLYDKIIDIFVQKIQERFKPSNLEPVLELFKVIMIEDIKTKINSILIYINSFNFFSMQVYCCVIGASRAEFI